MASIEEIKNRIDPSKFDTKLSPTEEAEFQAWKAINAPHDSGVDYDLRGAFKAGMQPGETGHWDDQFKKPNHPTFSTYSQYAKDYPKLAGTWDGETFIQPGQSSGVTGLLNAFQRSPISPVIDLVRKSLQYGR